MPTVAVNAIHNINLLLPSSHTKSEFKQTCKMIVTVFTDKLRINKPNDSGVLNVHNEFNINPSKNPDMTPNDFATAIMNPPYSIATYMEKSTATLQNPTIANFGTKEMSVFVIMCKICTNLYSVIDNS